LLLFFTTKTPFRLAEWGKYLWC